MKLLRQDQRQVSKALQSQDERWRIISQCRADTYITDIKTDDVCVHTLSTLCQNMWLRAWIKVKTHVGWTPALTIHQSTGKAPWTVQFGSTGESGPFLCFWSKSGGKN